MDELRTLHGSAQLRGAKCVERLEQREESIAERGDGPRGQRYAVLIEQGLSDLVALLLAEVASQPDVHDEVVAEALPRPDQSAKALISGGRVR